MASAIPSPCKRPREEIDVLDRTVDTASVVSYSGFLSMAGERVPVVHTDTQPEGFFREFVAQRRPCVVQGHLTDTHWKAENWDADCIAQQCGDRTVSVEYRDDAKENFGEGRERNMAFQEFVQRWKANDETLYLTTQTLPCAEDGTPYLTAQPTTGMIGCFPWRPSLMGSLIPQTVNLWMGCSSG
jgi:hypothetical protein